MVRVLICVLGASLAACEPRIQGRCVQGGRCTEYYRKTRFELDAARGTCRLFTADAGWFEDGSNCPTDDLLGTCHIREDGDLEIEHYYAWGYTEAEAEARCEERDGMYEPAS